MDTATERKWRSWKNIDTRLTLTIDSARAPSLFSWLTEDCRVWHCFRLRRRQVRPAQAYDTATTYPMKDGVSVITQLDEVWYLCVIRGSSIRLRWLTPSTITNVSHEKF
jgi:hypothetical protein